eukprot:GEMP01073061.1.p1 GENE.GEMP01073061.1~~GEMP01073061.1.p1  ORF type:complete len:179 (+),score=34.05 GEMP01073061.1:28-564(+)
MWNPDGQWGTSVAGIVAPTKVLELRNLEHPGRCRGHCCWQKKGPSTIGIRSNRSPDIWQCLASAARIGQEDQQLNREASNTTALAEIQKQHTTDFAAFQRARSFDASTMYPNLRTLDVTIKNTERANVPFKYRPDVIYYGERTNFGPAGSRTKFADKNKISNFSSVGYDILVAGGHHS